MTPKTVVLNASDHPVKAVTIFQSSIAELTRTFKVDLKAGNKVVEITGISSHVDRESPRIHALEDGVRVLDVSCSIASDTAPSHAKHSKNAAAILAANTKRKALVAEKNLRQQECGVLDNAMGSLKLETPADLSHAVERYVLRKRAAMEAGLVLDEQIEQIDRELWSLKNSHKGATGARIVATILAKREGPVTFQLTYLVSGVSWQPYYDLHANTSDGKTSSDVSLLYCANITQSTGEDWSDTALTLSTANSQALHSLSVPRVDPLKVTPAQATSPEFERARVESYQPQQKVQPVQRSTPLALGVVRHPQRTVRRVEIGPMVAHGHSDEEGDDFDMIGRSEEGDGRQGAALESSPLSLAYRVEGTVSLPSDGIAHRVSIASLGFSAELKYVCVPRKAAAAYIEGSVKNTSDYELLAGPVSVFMDEGFVTKTSLGLIGVDESFDCVLGVDTALKVSYEQSTRTEREPPRSFAEPTTTTTRTVTTTITNGHQFDISGLVVRDAIPLGDEDANVKVMLRKPEGLARAKEGEEVKIDLGEGSEEQSDVKVRWTKFENGRGGEKDGMYEWVCGVKAGKKVKLQAEWEVKAPSDLKWEEIANAKFDGSRK